MSNALQRILAEAIPYTLRLATTFRGVNEREGVLLRGPSGWGEFAPFVEYDDATCARWLAFAIEAAYGQWPSAVRSEVPVNAIVPSTQPQEAARLAYRAIVGDGCTTIKVKVAERGQTLDDDIARVAAVRATLIAAKAADGQIRIDVNGAWSVAEAVVAIRELDPIAGGLQYVEQPCATLDELAQLRRIVSVPIAADEVIRTAGVPLVALAHEAVDVVVIKAAHMGGVGLALQAAQAAGVPVVVSGSLDSAVGLSAGIALAASLPHLPYACGLGTGALLADDLLAEPLRPRHGVLQVARPEPDANAVAVAAANMSADRADWWRARLARAWYAGADILSGRLIQSSSDSCAPRSKSFRG